MPDRAEAVRMVDYIDGSPSPYHAVAEAVVRLEAAGFTPVDERQPYPEGGRHLVVRDGTLVAWHTPDGADPAAGFRIIGAHTDSPNLRIRPRPDTASAGWRQLGVEVYGGALLNSWLDRDLGLSGRVAVRDGDGVSTRLVRVDRPLLRIPQLAIHLDRGVNADGLRLNPQEHLNPVWATGPLDEGGFARFLATEAGVDDADLLAWDVMAHDVTPSRLFGRDEELVSAPRLDDLASCHAALQALVAVADGPAATEATSVVCLFDHEEVGSQTATGADSALLPTVLERIALAGGTDGRERFHRALAASRAVSADGAHATHPNYPERHEPGHRIAVNAGPVLKVNSNARYATDAVGGAWFALACERAGVPLQRFVTRGDLPCGSTIGPVTAARLGVPTVDVGMPQLAMHSARELCGAEDPGFFVRALTEALRDPAS